MAWVTAMHVAGDKRPDIIRFALNRYRTYSLILEDTWIRLTITIQFCRLKTLHDIVGNYKLKSIRNGNTPDDQGQWRDWERLKKTYNSEITAWAKVRLPKWVLQDNIFRANMDIFTLWLYISNLLRIYWLNVNIFKDTLEIFKTVSEYIDQLFEII